MRPSSRNRYVDLKPERLYLAYEACQAAAFGTIIPLFALYFRFAQLSLFDIALLAFVFEGTILLCELPTGALADLFGRVRALRLAAAILMSSGLLFVVSRSLPWFIFAEVLCGIGEAFRSGSADAWIGSEFERRNRRDDLPRIYALKVKYNFAATFLAMLLGGLVAHYLLVAGWALFALLSCGSLAISLLMNDSMPAVAGGDRHYLGRIVHHTAEGVRHLLKAPRLLAVLLLVLTANFAYEGLDQYWQVFLSENRPVPVLAFGLLTAATALILFLTADRTVPWFYRSLKLAPSIYLLSAVAVLTLVAFATASTPAILFCALVLFFVVRGLQEPLLVTYVAENSPERIRATTLSTQNLFSSAGEMIAALSVGLIASAAGLRYVFLAGAAFLVGGVLLFSVCFGNGARSRNDS